KLPKDFRFFLCSVPKLCPISCGALGFASYPSCTRAWTLDLYRIANGALPNAVGKGPIGLHLSHRRWLPYKSLASGSGRSDDQVRSVLRRESVQYLRADSASSSDSRWSLARASVQLKMGGDEISAHKNVLPSTMNSYIIAVRSGK